MHILFVNLLLYVTLVHSMTIVSASAPRTYSVGTELNIKVNSLTSLKTHIPFDYYSVPLPSPPSIDHHKDNLGDIISDNHIENSLYTIKIKQDETCTVVSDKKYTQQEVNQLEYLISNEYSVHMILDGIPATMKVITSTGDSFYEHGFPLGGVIADPQNNTIIGNAINNHLHFIIYYHETEDKLIEIHGFESFNRFSEEDVTKGVLHSCSYIGMPLNVISSSSPSTRILYTYAVEWVPSSRAWISRYDNYIYADQLGLATNIHWFSIANSILIVIFLAGILGVILLRTVFQDYSHYNRLGVEDNNNGDFEESGWKLLHADVFRPPRFMMTLLCATVGNGIQILLTCLEACFLSFYLLPDPSQLNAYNTIILFLYIINGYFSGYISSFLYKNLNGKSLLANFFITTFVYPCIFLCIILFMNSIHLIVHSSNAILFKNVFKLFSLLLCLYVPITYIGCTNGYARDPIDSPVVTSAIPREIPKKPWYAKSWILMVLGGVIPFGVSFVELYLMVTCLWGDRYYVYFGFILVIFILFILSCIEISMIILFAKLNNEDYNWWWLSLQATGSCSLFFFAAMIFCFSRFYELNSIIIITDFIGYVSIVSLLLYLIAASLGFISSYIFIHTIYGVAKIN
ncbi:hypothetical protein WA158_007673 [Blastocystis sp. Blastoise]